MSRLLLVISIMLMATSNALAKEPAGAPGAAVLQNNPFAAPADVIANPTTTADTSSTPLALQLRGTLLAGASSLADIDGEIIGLGQEIGGYQLIEIHDRHAVLQMDHRTTTIWVDDDSENDNANDNDGLARR